MFVEDVGEWIFISYEHDSRKDALKLNMRLKSAGFQTWIDVEHECRSSYISSIIYTSDS